MKTFRYTLFLVLCLGLSACGYIKGGVEDLVDLPIFEEKPTGTEVISGSSKGERTVNGYYVDTSVGSINSQIKATTANGYQVYYGIQGEIISSQ